MKEVEIDEGIYLDCFQHLIDLHDDIDIELIFGGRDSGKSKFVAQLFSEACMSLPYFRALLIKQTYESIKESQWQMIKDNVEDWDCNEMFTFLVSPLSIKCFNGNSMHARGMDNPSQIRSFTNPSHAWIEEANQLNEDAFVNILTGLRSDYGRVKLYLTFNPEATTPDYTDFWIYKTFYKAHEPNVNFTGNIEVKYIKDGKEKTAVLKYRSTHVTYQDNPYASPQRIAFHESLKLNNPYWYRVFTLGLWGNVENDSPWAFAFKRDKHVSNGVNIPHPILDRNHEVYLSWDFNRNPMTCTVIQWFNNIVKVLEVVRIPKGGVDGVCEYVLIKYPACLFIVTGDYNGNNVSSLFQEQVTHYLLIKHYLKLSDNQFKVKPNPSQAKNSTHINSVLAYYNVIIHGTDANSLVFDLENVKRRADGTIVKTDRNNPAQQSDSLDCFRYFCNAFLDWFKPLPENNNDRYQLLNKVNPTNGTIIDEQKLLQDKLNSIVKPLNPFIASVEAGRHIECTTEQYISFIRNDLINKATKWIEQNELPRARFAMEEVKRLDKKHLPS
jgi:PBSX family phage terminase large subunit